MQVGEDDDDSGPENPMAAFSIGDDPNSNEEFDDVKKSISRLASYAVSKDTCKRRMVGRSALVALRNVASNPAYAATILDIVSSVVVDTDSCVRSEVMELVPHMALFLSEEPTVPPLRALILSHLLPPVVEVLADPDQEVLKMAENALITMLEHCLVTGEYIEEKVWPVIEGRMKSATEPFALKSTTIGVLAMVSKMAPWIGTEVTKRLFIPLLVKLSKNPEFIIRRVCAAIFGEICTVIGCDVTEKYLLPSFLLLCRDKALGVRQACAESIMSVSCTVSLEVRKSILSPAFASLLSDAKVQVQLAAFQSLGPFITTFAQPSVTALAYNNYGGLVLKHPHGFEFNLPSIEKFRSPVYVAVLEGENDESLGGIDDFDSEESETVHSQSNSNYNKFLEVYCKIEKDSFEGSSGSSSQGIGPINGELGLVYSHQRSEPILGSEGILEDMNYNQFNFWRDPILSVSHEDLPKDVKPQITQATEEHVDLLVNVIKDLGLHKDTLKMNKKSEAVNCSYSSSNSNSSGFTQEKYKEPTRPGQKQDIVPEELIRHFVSMTEIRLYRPAGLAHHCAYNLPAVALTLGPGNWTLLKDAYETLAADKQWRVRRIVASSIHELAVIVGEDVATQDLVPVFNGFIKDLDEVRIGALKHLAHFLKLLKPAGRNSFLPRLAEFLTTDYDWNWRFREELGAQLLQSLGLFTPSDTCQHLTPIAISLLLDDVAQVRKVALHLVTELVNHVSIDVGLLRGLLAELAAQFAHSNQWRRRQTFAFLCTCLLSERVLSEEMFARDVLPHLLDLSWDRVPNVRLAVAKVLASHAMANPYFADPLSPHHEVLVAVLKRLQGDRDRDVRYFATLPPLETIPFPQTAQENHVVATTEEAQKLESWEDTEERPAEGPPQCEGQKSTDESGFTTQRVAEEPPGFSSQREPGDALGEQDSVFFTREMIANVQREKFSSNEERLWLD